MNNPDSRFEFPLLWTIGFAGKRYLAEENKVAAAIAQALDFLKTKATEAGAGLTAISSLARGGDVLFAEACLDQGIPWRGLIPFEWEDFLRRDLPPNDPRGPLPEPERNRRLEAARRLRRASFGVAPKPEPDEPIAEATNVFPDPMVVTLGVNPENQESRETAYQDCSYQTVDEADVMIFVLTGEEFRAALDSLDEDRQVDGKFPKAGTRASAHYAYAARKPCIFLNAEANDPWDSKEIRRKSENKEEKINWFVDPIVTEAMRIAVAASSPKDKTDLPKDSWRSRRRLQVYRLGLRLGALADYHRNRTQYVLVFILLLHLIATCLAGLSATVLSGWWWKPLAMLAFLKAGIVLGAVGTERIFHQKYRDRWLYARILGELCRSAISTWPLPLQPLEASDEEDFPRLKRLIRTLRLMRAMDAEAAVRGSPRHPGETSLEANMRTACDIYIEGRLNDQKKYYAKHAPRHQRTKKLCHTLFLIAVLLAIGAGVALGMLLITQGKAPEGDPTWWWERGLEATLIIAPFAAAFFLGVIAILDSRRRSARYGEMKYYLERLADTLQHCASNPSRLRLIEHAERMLIEEQHEWFSVTRNTNV